MIFVLCTHNYKPTFAPPRILDKLIHLGEFRKEWLIKVRCTQINVYKTGSYSVKMHSL